MELLAGYRTYLVAAAYAVVTFVEGVGWIDAGTADKIREVLIGLGAMTFRAALKRP